MAEIIMRKLKIFNEVNGFRVPRKKLAVVFERFLKREKVGGGVGGNFNVNLIFVRDGKMTELNREYRGRKGTTDVLSFNYEDGLGEIYISLDEVRRNSSDIINEVLALFAHGLLHLAGHTHETDRKMKTMIEKANEICG
ncbi:rRNA maturation RNase YbeY [Candidatus Peregrinibacteria bacterium]|jgi:rRNA maturation RNase YbeY|nr:rRNA maturation RNase YbeY [Candidatus Peregrinibacteria bacterium]MBT4147658.1 rRNA maturation RNase YbeY [Candidatus Peregrinibacteria bacterium]MBT4366286.1 rRNA maturation RNase YbeY [Candidatus Peregrinibacteria bacterium]MBT4455786.1 rRNA maturation RNase YbeY [Candidatus Peregrinibacteria bacterium]